MYSIQIWNNSRWVNNNFLFYFWLNCPVNLSNSFITTSHVHWWILYHIVKTSPWQLEMNSVRSRHRMKGKWWWQTKVPALHRPACRRGRPRSNSWLRWEITGILQAFPNLATSRRHLSSLLPWCYQGPGPTVALCGSRPRFPSAHVCVTLSVKRPDAISCVLDGVGRGQERERTHRSTSREGDIVRSQRSTAFVSKIGQLKWYVGKHIIHTEVESAGRVGGNVANVFNTACVILKKNDMHF